VIQSDRALWHEACTVIITATLPYLPPAVSAHRRAIAEVKQHWLVIGWATKNLLSRAPPCFGRHVEPLVPSVFAVVKRLWVRVVGYGPFFLCVIHKEGLCLSSGDINGLMMKPTQNCLS
jgi:hypothetical protein